MTSPSPRVRAGLGLAAAAVVIALGAGSAVLAAELSDDAEVAETVPVVTTSPTASSSPTGSSAPQVVDVATGPITPAPDKASAIADTPAAYADGCQVPVPSTEVVTCTYGDPDGDRTLVLVGDSKVLQWQPAFDALGKAHGWRVVTMTKSGCAFAAGEQATFDVAYPECAPWNENAMAQLLELQPAAVVTSQYWDVAIVGHGQRRSSAMVDGLVQHWSRLQDGGVPVVVLLNNPTPPVEAGQVYDCVAAHLTRLSACAFPVDATSGATAAVQRAAAEQVPGVGVLDLNDVICPDDVCPAVIDDVLVYRNGSHLTMTEVDALTAVLEERLLALPAAAGLR